MPNNARNWISRLSETCEKLSETEQRALEMITERPEISTRVRLALKIINLRSRVLRPVVLPSVPTATEATAIDLADQIVPVQPPEPFAEIPPPPTRPKKPKKVSFSAVSLDDAAGLLSAFGTLAEPSPSLQTDEHASVEKSKQIAKDSP